MRHAELHDLGGGVHRVTQPLPWALDHVHCYAIDEPDGFTIVDTGLGTPGTIERWRLALAELGAARVRRIVITHYHPDHIGCSAALAELTGAEQIVQGAHDWELTPPAFGDERIEGAFERHLLALGMPESLAFDSAAEERELQIRFRTPDVLVREGDVLELAGEPFRVLELPGHADGHIALLGERSGRLFGGDVLLNEITPNVGLWEDSGRGDPLADYLATLARIEALAPAYVLPGHRSTVETPIARARAIRAHHAARLDDHAAALKRGARTPYDVVLQIWGANLGFHERRFAVVEAAAHLVRLVGAGRAVQDAPGRFGLATEGTAAPAPA